MGNVPRDAGSLSPSKPRVVSLVPSITETLLAWGVVPVGVSKFCDIGDQSTISRVGGTKDPDIQRIVQLNPDLVLLCREENRLEDANALIEAGIEIYVTEVRSLDDVASTLSALAKRIEVESWEHRCLELEKSIHTVSAVAARRRRYRAFVPIWRRPWMTLNNDTYGSSMLAALGVVNVFGDSPDRYPIINLEQARDTHPDLVIAPSEPYPFSLKHHSELHSVAPVLFVDGRDLFWWGIRTPNALVRLANSFSSYDMSNTEST